MSRLSRAGLLTGAMVLATACSSDRLNVPNYQNPTVNAITSDPAAALPLLATGVLRDDRTNAPVYVLGMGIFGREAYNYTPTEGRNTSGYLTADVRNGTSFGGGSNWANPYFTLRDAFNTSTVLESEKAAAVFSAGQKNATRGFLHTMEALSLLYLINTRDVLGIPVEITADPTALKPFVSRDSVFKHIVGRLDQALTELQTAGTTAFPFTFHSGYAGFTTPVNYIKFNRALAARVNAYRASYGLSGCGAPRSAACYQLVLTNLSASFIDPAGSLTLGTYNVFSAAANDLANSLSNQASTNVVAHFKADSGIMLRADGTPDLRFVNKDTAITAKSPPSTVDAVPTPWDYKIYRVRTDPIPIIRNEELILLRAEAKYFTGDQTGALDDINTIRTRSGGLVARGPFVSETDFIDELLYNRRLSLLFEGHRWVDMRRFGRLNLLTLDRPTHVVVNNLPVPQAECLARAGAEASLKGPGC
jgi:starch-binding outer membrane protein, SusD/RagB family